MSSKANCCLLWYDGSDNVIKVVWKSIEDLDIGAIDECVVGESWFEHSFFFGADELKKRMSR